VEDRALRVAPRRVVVRSREAAHEEHRGRLGHDDDALAHLAPKEVDRGRLAATRTPSDDDAPRSQRSAHAPDVVQAMRRSVREHPTMHLRSRAGRARILFLSTVLDANAPLAARRVL
jgi:hypothetical protein